MKIAILGNYLPRRCGIATFTANLTSAIIKSNSNNLERPDVFVVAMNDGNEAFDYPDIVRMTIDQNDRSQYLKAAQFINDSNVDICIVQHEFGIFGGESGVYVLRLMHELRMPIITTLHTILRTPNFHERHIIKKMGELSQKMIVMSHLAVEFLDSIYDIPKEKIEMVLHGVPDFSSAKSASGKFKYGQKKLMGTFGFLGRSKGIETVINALPRVVKEHPDLVYVVMGQTHPNVKKHSGEEYRDYLKNLALENGVSENVVFEDGFFEEEDLKSFLVKLDIYITPYLNEAQITSGTISYAVGAGACTVSTPFWHAKELLAGGRGRMFAFNDSDELALVLNDLLNNPVEIGKIKKASFAFGKKMYWNQIGHRYNTILQELKVSTSIQEDIDTPKRKRPLPDFSMKHIKRLTDETGIIEHANYSVPDFKEGYCLDDNVRALLLVLMADELNLDKTSTKLADTYLRYIKLMQKGDGFFHNDMAYDKTFLDETGSDDSFGRTIWTMGYLIELAPNDSHLQFAKDVFFGSFKNFEKIKSIRAIANTILGIYHFLKRYPGDENVMHVLHALTNKLLHQYSEERSDQWRWFEPILSYENAILPLALWHSYSITRDKKTLEVALESTIFLDDQIYRPNHISLVGNQWQRKGQERSMEGQQPIDAMAMVMLYGKAFDVTKNKIFYRKMHTAFSWFLGNNDLLVPLFDSETKGCCDGLSSKNVNRNQGAESTISYLLSYLFVIKYEDSSISISELFEAEKEKSERKVHTKTKTVNILKVD